MYALLTSLVLAGTLTGEVTHTRLLDEIALDPVVREVVAPRHMPVLLPPTIPMTELDTAIDVLSYDVALDWSTVLRTARAERGPRKCDASITIELRVQAPTLDEVVLNARYMEFDSILVNGARVEPNVDVPGLLAIPLPTPATRNDVLRLDIAYGIMRDDRGFQAYSDSDMASTGQDHAIAFTFCQPEGARTWYPCHDVPYDKAMFTAHVRVPNDFVVASNGRRLGRAVVDDSTVRETWRHEQPMSTYLFVVNASRYVDLPQVYVRAVGDTMQISNYQWQDDVDGERFKASNAIRNVPEMFRVMEPLFGRYPFATYGHAAVTPIQFGGMEHQSMTTVNREWLRGTAELGYAHEVGHQWFGDWVTCATWADIWLNEGAATWSEAIFAGRNGNVQGYRARMGQRRDRYLRNGLAEPPIYGIDIQNLFNEATTYCKSAWVYHMLRTNVSSDSILFAGLRAYLQRYARGAAQTAQFAAFWQEFVPDPMVPWTTYFDQWLVKAGHPVFEAVLARPTSGDQAIITVTQTQVGEGIPETFVVPLRLRLRTATASRDTVVLMTERSMSLRMAITSDSTELLVDPDDEILCERTVQTITSVQADDNATWCRVLGAVPVRDHVSLHLSDGPEARITISDVGGRVVYAGRVGSGIHRIDLRSLPSGVVAIRAERGTNVTTFAIPVIAP